jgi:hypothetical protein
VDTDRDGMSDYEEVNNDRNPVVFGTGGIDNIEKIKKINLAVIGIKEQKKNFEEYQKKIKDEEKEKFEAYLKKNRKKLSEKEIIKIKEKFNNKLEIKNDFNKMGAVIISFDSQIDLNKTNIFKVFFNKLNKNKEEKYNLTEDDLNYIEKVANIDLSISEKLAELKLKDRDVISFNNDLINIYKKIGLSIKKLLSDYKNIENNKNLKMDMEEYYSAVSSLVSTRQFIHIFINSKNISFSAGDKGSVFFYSI